MFSKAITIQLPESEDGMTDRQCPRCQGQFAIHLPSFEDQCYRNVRCPYCKFIDELDRFLTGNQRAYVQAIGEDETLRLAGGTVGEMLEDAFGGLSGGGLIEISFSGGDVDFGSVGVPSPESPIEKEDIICSECAFRYSVEDERDGVCPVCR